MDKPLLLKANDTVAIVSPASNGVDDELITAGIKLLESWGLQVKNLANHNKWHYLAAPDAERAECLNQAFADDTIKAIFSLRGGYGCARLNDYLDWQMINSKAKILVGFSDITYLHLALASTQHRCIHGPNIGNKELHSDESNDSKAVLYETLFTNSKKEYQLSPIIGGDAVGELTGGCLSIVVTTLGTPHEIDTNGKILLLEDVNEAIYSIDRMLTHLKQAGKFDNVNGIVFGDCFKAKDHDFFLDAINSLFSDNDFPVYHGLAFGHEHTNLAWEYKHKAKLTKNKLQF